MRSLVAWTPPFPSSSSEGAGIVTFLLRLTLMLGNSAQGQPNFSLPTQR